MRVPLELPRHSRRDIALACVAALAVLALPRGPRELVAARGIAGAPELLGVLVARLAPSHAPFAWLHRLDRVILAIGTFLLARAAQRASKSGVSGATVAVAAAASADLAPHVGAIGAVGWLIATPLISALWTRDARTPLSLGLWLILAASAAIWPVVALGCGVIWLLHGGRPAAAAPTFLLVAAGTWAATPAVTSTPLVWSLVPGAAAASPAALGAHLFAVPLDCGPYVCALAAFGAFVSWRLWTPRAIAATAAAAAVSLLALPPYPWPICAIVVWIAAAAGLGEIIRGARHLPARLGVALLVALVPILSWMPLPRGTGGGDPDGHERASLAAMQRWLTEIPPDGHLVSEDASVDVLLRAAERWRSTPLPAVIARDALERGGSPPRGLYAFPWAQRRLQLLGYRTVGLGDAPLAALAPEGSCRTANAEWRALDTFGATSAFALVARQADEAGPIVIYTTFAGRPVLTPLEWPAPALRGFYPSLYDTAAPGDLTQLRQDAKDDAFPDARALDSAPFVVRLELWRTPTAPEVLGVDLGARPGAAWARVIAAQPPKRLTVCAAFPSVPRPF